MRYTARTFSPHNKKALKQFLELPKMLYTQTELIQNEKTETELIMGRHVLSRYFSVFPVIALDSGGKVSARCMVTVYHNSDCAYFGFFESINSPAAAYAVIGMAERIARKFGKSSLIGPVDCSFWLGYRLKTDNFGCPYTGEPYNMPYYEELLKKCGFTEDKHYISNCYGKCPESYSNAKYEARLREFIENGYVITSPDKTNIDRVMGEIYRLISYLYSDFPVYSRITEREFRQIYEPLKRAADYSMVKLAYFEGEPVGFFVSVPDYSNLSAGSMTVGKLLKLIRTKKHPRRYIMLYMGASPNHRGLGKALAEDIRETLAKNGAYSVGALIMEGKVTGDYFSELVERTNNYILMKKENFK